MTESTPQLQKSPLLVRALESSDWSAAKAVDAAAFGYQPDDDFLDTVVLPAQDIGRFTGVFDPTLDQLLLGIGAIQSRRLTFPGSASAAVAAVTWVGARPDQQRRGVLRALMTAQLHGLKRTGGEAVAILTASESGIYGRFGYGLAAHRSRLQIPAPTALRPGTVVEPVQESGRAEAEPAMKRIYATARAGFVGYLDRSDAVWNTLLTEHPFARKDRSARRIALHPDGYIHYGLTDSWNDRGPDYTLTVSEICATTPIARASLWKHVLAYPLVRKVDYAGAWVDEPLPDMLGNPRDLTASIRDHVWLRLVDLTRAIGLRTYSTAADLVVKVADSFCPWNDDTWRLRLTRAGGSATRSAGPADLELDIADLGAAFLGGTRIARLAAAGRITGTDGAVANLDAALSTPLRPWTPEGF